MRCIAVYSPKRVDSIERFFASGVLELQNKLGPVNWQFAPTKQFDPDDFENFLKLLPAKVQGKAIRHSMEVRHESFADAAFVKLLRKYKMVVVVAGDSKYPQIADVTAPFVYTRIVGTTEKQKSGYGKAALDRWTERARVWAAGGAPEDLDTFGPAPKTTTRDVFLYVISGYKVSNPAAAMGLVARIEKAKK